MKSLRIAPLKQGDGAALSCLLEAGGDDYCEYFRPFPFDAVTLEKTLSGVKEDRFWGISSDDALIGFFMLRGFDAGFDIPSYGVYVAKAYAGKGVSSLTLRFVEVWGKLNHVRKVMIKVHPKNLAAKRIYEKAGAVLAGTDEKNANLIYYLSIC